MKLLPVIALAALAFFLFVKYIERTALYYPSRTLSQTPKEAGLAFEDVYFGASDGVKLHGWLVKGDNAGRTLLFCHGNAGNISDRVEKIRVLRELGFNVFIFDYRGYGMSQGEPSEQGVYRDTVAAYDQLVARPDIGKVPVFVYGESLGGAIAVDLASKRKVAGLIVESGFASARDMARIYYPFVPSFMVMIDFDSARKVKAVTAPKLIIHSRTDEMIPFSQAEKLFAAASAPKEFLAVEGNHNDNFFQSEGKIREGLMKFLKGHGL